MAGSAVGTRSPGKRAAHIQALLAEIGKQMGAESRLLIAVFRLFYDVFTVACLTAAAVVIIGGRRDDAFLWGGTGIGLALGWVAARLALKGVVRMRRAFREEWTLTSADVSNTKTADPKRPT